MQLYYTYFLSDFGQIALTCDEKQNLVGLSFKWQNDIKGILKDDIEIFTRTKIWLKNYFKGKNPSINELPLSLSGSEFRLEVWKTICKIPYGETISYGKIAEQIAQNMGLAKMSSQAIGGALSANPILIIIPCHRVIGKNGDLRGYAGGLKIKKMLLKRESQNLKKCFLSGI